MNASRNESPDGGGDRLRQTIGSAQWSGILTGCSCLRRVVRQFRLCADVVINLNGWNIGNSIAGKRVDVVADQAAAVRQRNHGLNLQRDRIHSILRNDIVRKRIANQAPVWSCPCCLRIVNGSLDDGPAKRISPQHTSRNCLSEIAITVFRYWYRIGDCADVLMIAELFEIKEEECFVMTIIDFLS